MFAGFHSHNVVRPLIPVRFYSYVNCKIQEWDLKTVTFVHRRLVRWCTGWSKIWQVKNGRRIESAELDSARPEISANHLKFQCHPINPIKWLELNLTSREWAQDWISRAWQRKTRDIFESSVIFSIIRFSAGFLHLWVTSAVGPCGHCPRIDHSEFVSSGLPTSRQSWQV